MPRKPTARSNTAIRFPPELHEQLAQAAADRDMSMNFLVVKAVEDFLRRLIPSDELTLTRDPPVMPRTFRQAAEELRDA